MAVWMIFSVLRIFLNATTVCPPAGGVLGTMTTATFLPQRMDDLGPLHNGLLHKHI